MANLEGVFFLAAGAVKTIKADTGHRFVLLFDAPIEASDTTVLRFFLHDPAFHIDYTLPDVAVTALEAPAEAEERDVGFMSLHNHARHVRICTLTFPEQLAGGTFSLEVMVSKDPKAPGLDLWKDAADEANENLKRRKAADQRARMEIEAGRIAAIILGKEPQATTASSPEQIPLIIYLPVEAAHFRLKIEVVSAKQGAPKVHNIYVADNEEIEFGKDTTTTPGLARTAPVGAHSGHFVHVHTRGLYGAMVHSVSLIQSQNATFNAPPVRVKDNTAIFRGNSFKYMPGNASTYTLDIYVGQHETDVTVPANRATKARRTSIQVRLNRVEPISASTSAVFTSVGGEVFTPETSQAECKVEFRPLHHQYDGSFGFSWYRFGDMAICGTTSTTNSRLNHTFNVNSRCNDQPFSAIMGRHYEPLVGIPNNGGTQPILDSQGNPQVTVVKDGNNSSIHTAFQVDLQMSKNHRHDYHRIEMPQIYPADPNDPADPKDPKNEYYIPWMTIRKDVTARLQLFMTIKTPPDKLIIDFDNPAALSEGYLTIDGMATPYEIVSPQQTSGTPDITNSISIKCLKEFSKPLRLRVRAEVTDPADTSKKLYHLCGAVNILPNDIAHQRRIKVVLFNVITRVDINQAALEGIDLGSGSRQAKENTLRRYLGQAYIHPQIEIVGLDLVDTLTSLTHSGYTSLCKSDNSTGKLALNYDESDKIKEFLLSRISADYKEYFKVFFIAESLCKIDSSTGLYNIVNIAGFSSGEKFTLCAPVLNGNSVPTHELLHSLGLPHTFDGSTSRAQYVYEDGMTDNIMDYASYSRVEVQSLFHWQWQALNIKL